MAALGWLPNMGLAATETPDEPAAGGPPKGSLALVGVGISFLICAILIIMYL